MRCYAVIFIYLMQFILIFFSLFSAELRSCGAAAIAAVRPAAVVLVPVPAKQRCVAI